MLKDIKRLLKHSFIYSLGNIAMRSGAFILLPLYTHHLTVAEYGILELLGSISSVLSSFLSIGLAHATLRFYFEYDDLKDRNAVISSSLFFCFFVSLPPLFFLSFFNPTLSALLFDSLEYIPALNLAYLILVLELARQIGLSFMRAREYSLMFVAVSVGQLVVQVICNVYTVVFLKLGVNGILFGNMVSVLFGTVFCTILILVSCGLRFDLTKISQMVKYSYPFLFTSIINVCLSNADRFLLKTLLSVEAVGIYGLALKFGLLLKQLIIEPFQRSFGAFRFSIMKQANSRQIQARSLNYLLFIVIWAGLGIIFFGGYLIKFLTTSAFHGVLPLIPFVVLSYVMNSTGYVFQTGILFEKRTIKLFHISLLTGLVGLLISFFSITLFGLVGASLALILQSAIYVVLTYTFSQRLYEVRYANNQIILIACFALTLLLLSHFTSDSPPASALLAKVLLFLFFPMAMYRSSFFLEEEKQAVACFFKRLRSPNRPPYEYPVSS
jgi:O-antigen/teichoic acid export membrane protein